MKGHTYKWDKIVLGSTLPAYLFAYHHSLPVVGYKSSAPHQFANSGDSLHDWNALSFLLGLSAQIPFYDNISSVKITEEGLKVTTEVSYKPIDIECNKIFLFDDRGVEGLPPVVEEGRLYEIMDWIDVRSIQPHEIKEIDCEKYRDSGSLIKKIYFCNTGRVENPRNKDICAISYMNSDLLDNFLFSETMMRMEVESILRQEGLRGCIKNKVSETRKSANYKEIHLESAYREKRRIMPHTYSESEMIEYMLDKEMGDFPEKNFSQNPLFVAHLEDS